MTPAECLEQVRQILTAHGVDVGGPPCTDAHGWFGSLPGGAHAELYETEAGTLTWRYATPTWISTGPGSTGLAARMTLALLHAAPAAGLPAAGESPALREAAARMLEAAGLATLPRHYCYQPGEVYPELLASHPGDLARGTVRITDSEIIWEFCPATPSSPGLSALTAASAIAAALDEARRDGTEGTAADASLGPGAGL
jgi:hypothetical protein